MKTNFSTKYALIVGIVLVLIFFIFHLFLIKDIKERNENISVWEREIALQDRTQGYLISQKRMLENADSDLSKIENSIVPKEGEVKFIQDIEASARRLGMDIEINSITFEENATTTKANLGILVLKTRVSGTFSATYKFLEEIESLPIKV